MIDGIPEPKWMRTWCSSCSFKDADGLKGKLWGGVEGMAEHARRKHGVSIRKGKMAEARKAFVVLPA